MLLKAAAIPALAIVKLSIPTLLSVLTIAEKDKLLISVVAVVIVVLAVAPVTFTPFCYKLSVAVPSTGAVKVTVTFTR